MSRLGKKPISIPEGVEIEIKGRLVAVKGPKGQLEREIRPEIKVEKKEKEIVLTPLIETKKTKSFWGLTRAIIANMIEGVVKGFEKKLQIEGVGYRANLEGDDLVLQIGFSHPVKIKKEQGINFSVEKNIITISGINKEKVGEMAAEIRAIRPPEPYKGKGIRYFGEQVRRKSGKKVVSSAGAA
ncbi:MAG: 50S ribosomal protein L6 [Candidatus Pacebacteria bacterium]|nr:50S ribosomal protein L6 [Candidatus Paceibacterota bacterium]